MAVGSVLIRRGWSTDTATCADAEFTGSNAQSLCSVYFLIDFDLVDDLTCFPFRCHVFNRGSFHF